VKGRAFLYPFPPGLGLGLSPVLFPPPTYSHSSFCQTRGALILRTSPTLTPIHYPRTASSSRTSFLVFFFFGLYILPPRLRRNIVPRFFSRARPSRPFYGFSLLFALFVSFTAYLGPHVVATPIFQMGCKKLSSSFFPQAIILPSPPSSPVNCFFRLQDKMESSLQKKLFFIPLLSTCSLAGGIFFPPPPSCDLSSSKKMPRLFGLGDIP